MNEEQVERVTWAMREASDKNGLELTYDACEPLARAAIDAMGEQWQPIETAPKGGTFLVYLPEEHRKMQVMYRSEGSRIAVIGGAFAFDMSKPTHWMPLKEPE